MDTIISPNEKIIWLMLESCRHDLKNMQKEEFLSMLQSCPAGTDEWLACPTVGCHPSVFNYVVPREDNYIIYNTMYNTLVRVSEEELRTISNPESRKPDEVFVFLKNGLLMPQFIEERSSYLLYAALFTRYLDRPYSYTIAPTMECNACCGYCYENGVRQGSLATEDIDAVLKFICNHEVSHGILLTWFGGEPLLNPNWIDCFVSSLQAHGISYKSSMITNGSLVAEVLKAHDIRKWNLTDVQITLDGTAQEHERRKSFLDQPRGNYQKIMDGISLLSKAGIHVNIRMNIDSGNTEDILLLEEELEERFGEDLNVTFYPAFLTGRMLTEEEGLAIVRRLLKRLKNPRKMQAPKRMYSLPKTHPCMKADAHAFVIGVSGEVYSCEHHLGKKNMAIAKITDTMDDPHREEITLPLECQECVFLPKCMGGCDSNRQGGDIPCMIEKYIIKGYLELL